MNQQASCSAESLARGCRSNQCLELTALEHRGSAIKGREESALSGLGKCLLAAVQVGR
jgi:hypothetical protein